MKTILPRVVAAAILLTATSHALTPVKETFTKKKLDPQVWYQYTVGNAKLTPAKKKLNFVAKAKPSPHDFASMELLTSQPGYNESWELTLSLSNTAGLGDGAGCGMMLFNVQDRNDFMFLEFYGKGPHGGLAAGVLVNGKLGKKAVARVNPGIAKGSIRLSFDKGTKLMTLHVSKSTSPKQGDWIKIGTFSPDGKGGDLNANWNMNPGGGRFGVQLIGFGRGHVVPSGKVTLDNLNIRALP